MSIRAMTWVWDQPIAPNHKIVLLAIADHAHDDGTNAWPSADRIAEMTGYSTRSVRRIIHEMVEAGYLEIEKPGGGRFTSRYALPVGTHLPPDVGGGVTRPAPDWDDEDPGQNDTPAVTPPTTHPGHPRPGTPDTGDKGTVLEPDPEPSENPAPAEPGAEDESERFRETTVTADAIITPADINPIASERQPIPTDRDETNPLWNALEDVFSYRPTGNEARLWGKLTKELKLLGAEPDEVADRARRLVAQWGARALTPSSLVKHWARFGSPIGAATEADEDRLRQEMDRGRRRRALGATEDPSLPPGHDEPADQPADPQEEYHNAMQRAREDRETILDSIAEVDADEREDDR